MEDNRILYDAFNIYYENGMTAIKQNQYEVARRNIYAAAETILKLAKISNGTLKAQRMKRAEDLYSLANKIEIKQNNERQTFGSVKNDIEKLTAAKQNTSVDDDTLSDFQPVSAPDITLDDVAGLDGAKAEIRRLIIEPRKYPEIYDKFKRQKGGGILLYGVPGTGKTMIAQAIANEIDAKFYSIKCSDIASKWFGDSEQNIKKLFAEARKNPCAIIFFDEFEALGAKRDSHSTVMKRLVPELLSQMQGFEKSKNTLLLIAATNRPWDIDTAFLRPGRFNTCVYVPLPDEKARYKIIQKQLDGVPVSDNFDYNDVVERTSGFNGSDVVEFCNKLKDYAIERTIKNSADSKIIKEDIEYTADRVKSSVRLEDLTKINAYEKNFNA
jgi:transitional endoplasmic reticulum ATPase